MLPFERSSKTGPQREGIVAVDTDKHWTSLMLWGSSHSHIVTRSDGLFIVADILRVCIRDDRINL